MKLAKLFATVSLTALLAATAQAADLSILQFSQGVFAVAPAPNHLARVLVPGGKVLATQAAGSMARIDVEEGVAICAAVPHGVAGRLIHLDIGAIDQVDLADDLAVAFGAGGTVLYFPGNNQLVGLKLSEGYPLGTMSYGKISAANWGEQVALYGVVEGRVYRYVFPSAGMQDLHVGEDSVVTMWQGRGTFMHLLSRQGWVTTFLSQEFPGNLSARAGLEHWMKVEAAATNPGVPMEAAPFTGKDDGVAF